jgi:asparagine synthase (glutamine-hydrolysing)
LKATFAKVLPKEVLDRRKAGFPIPYESWLRRELNSEVKDVLLSDRATSRGYFRKAEVNRLLHAQTNSSGGKYSKEVFCLLALELWHRQFADSLSTPASANFMESKVGAFAG